MSTTLAERLSSLAQRIAAEFVSVKQSLQGVEGSIGLLTNLNTTAKSDLVTAINEVLTDASTVAQNLQNLITAQTSDLEALSTDHKNTYGAAINELKLSIDQLALLTNSRIGDLSTLGTTTKASLVAAINEVNAALANIEAGVSNLIDDTATTSATKTWSVDKIKQSIQAAKDELLGGAPSAALDTLKELGDALTNEESAIAAITTALAKRVAVDQAQTFTDAEKAQGWTNFGIGDYAVDFVAVFNTALGGTQPSVG